MMDAVSPSAPDPGAFWDQMYAGEVYRYGTAPNAFLVAQVHHLPPGGQVLCAGDGEGRNGVWLAEQGFRVTSLDPSRVANEKARRLAEVRGVTLTVLNDRLPAPALPDASFDAVVLTYVHVPPALRSAVHRDVVRLLRPGGVVLLEAFTPAQLSRTSGGPRDEAMLYTPALLRDDFTDLHIERLSEETVELDEGPGHTGLADVVRLVACKPPTGGR